MNGDGDAPEIPTTDEGERLDLSTATALLEQTRRQAEREFEIRTPLLMLIAAVLVLLVYGGIWLSVRGQQPYVGPSGTALVVVYTILLVAIAVVAFLARRASSGIGGHSAQRRRTAAGMTFGSIYVLLYVFDGALDLAGAGPAILYGIYPAAAPLVIIGGAAATYGAAQEEWGWSALALAVVALGALAACAGPANVWGVIGVGFSLLLLARCASLTWHWQGPAWARTDER